MAIGVTLFVITILVAVVWILIEFQRFKHKMLAIFLIGLILFSYISFSSVLKGKDIDYGSVDGMAKATGLYFSWLGGVFGNVKSITAHAVSLDWKKAEDNKTFEELKDPFIKK